MKVDTEAYNVGGKEFGDSPREMYSQKKGLDNAAIIRVDSVSEDCNGWHGLSTETLNKEQNEGNTGGDHVTYVPLDACLYCSPHHPIETVLHTALYRQHDDWSYRHNCSPAG